MKRSESPSPGRKIGVGLVRRLLTQSTAVALESSTAQNATATVSTQGGLEEVKAAL